MIKEGEELYTTNLCQQCYNKSLEAKEDTPLTKWQWYSVYREKGASWKAVENDGKRTIHTGIFCQERARVKRFREEAEEERQAGIQGQWLEPPAREYLEQVKSCNDTACTHRMMKQGFLALKSGEWVE